MGSNPPERPMRPFASTIPIGVGLVIDGKYAIDGVLGSGGTGVVYDALALDGGQPVALKVIHSGYAGDEMVRARFNREVTILGRLRGAHLCPVIGSGEAGDPRRPSGTLLYIALGKIDGSGLDSVLRDRGRLSVAQALDICTQICVALESAHAQGIIHRDLKPANVLITKAGEVFVVDFGLAKIIRGAGEHDPQITNFNMTFGTPEYMAPEQARGDDLDERCDIYAMGIILYELLVGEVPFQSANSLAVLTAHTTRPAPSPRSKAPERVSAALDAVVLRALAKSRDARYASARELAAALREAIVTEPLPDEVAVSLPAPPAPTPIMPLGPSAAEQKPSAAAPPLPTLPSPLLSPLLSPKEVGRRIASSPRRPVKSASRPDEPPKGTWSRTTTVAIWVVVLVVSAIAGLFASRHVH